MAVEQKEILQHFDRTAMIEAILFNILIGNTDWSAFALNPRRPIEGLKNIDFVANDKGTIFAVAYDFDKSELISGTRSFTKEDYKTELTLITQHLERNFSGFLLSEFKTVGAQFKAKLDRYLQKPAAETDVFWRISRERFANFSLALGEYSL